MRKTTLVALLAALMLTVAASQAGQRRPRPAKASWMVTKAPKDKVIAFALYTLHNNTLKLTAQLYELDADAPRTVRLEVNKDGKWGQVAETQVIERGWTAPFRVEKWDADRDWQYRVAHADAAFYTGTIRRDPVDKDVIVVAAFTGNSNRDRGPRPDLIANIKKQDPDLLFFSGDQVYDHGKHFPSWLIFGKQFGEIMRDRPTITIPDDHDVGNGNLWGAGGKEGPGGYKNPEFIKEVERAQTSHLPDPYDPTPIERGIGVYYTSLNWGRIGFAVIEDRKFKSQTNILDKDKLPGVHFSRADHVKALDADPRILSVPNAKLLGERQLKFLNAWSADWTGQDMKAVLSQTVFAGAAHLHGGPSGRLLIDLDSNGWPQKGRDDALDAIRKGFGLMIGGDQHLATVIHHGITDWEDAGVSFCVPSVINYYNRWWMPLEKPVRPIKTPLEHTGRYRDGFGNRVSMFAYANPDPKRPKLGKWGARAAGHGIIRFNKKTRKMTIECWPRGCDVENPEHKQYPGWPRTFSQADQYGRKAAAYLPTIEVTGQTNPVVQIIDKSTQSIVYTIRILGTTFRPRVFKPGAYTVKVGEGANAKTLTGVKSLPEGKKETIKVAL
ncbi:alkaline phosphatase D family protein [bacterium]|nr:alkaline phosphatase D family protein [bacterium]